MSTPSESPEKDHPAPPSEPQQLPEGDPAKLMGLGLPSEAGGNPSRSPDEGETLDAAQPAAAPADTAAALAAVAAAAAGAPFVPPSVSQLAGLFSQLQILELLGHGGMGAVYKARQAVLDRFVAVKILPPQVSRSPGFAQRFMREARALARLSHPNIVAVHDFGKVVGPQGDLYYIVMEYVDGANLRQLIRSKSITPAEALAIVPQVCEALQFAHDEGVVHRDIKPENILIDKKGRVRIADFGLAKLAPGAIPAGGEAGPEVHTLTQTGGTMGTPRYMAPEQMEGAHDVDHRADIYSLGVVFYEMLTGEVPMGRFAPPSKRVQVDVRLDEIVLRALEREPEQRYQHASEVKTQVEQVSRTPGAAKPAHTQAKDAGPTPEAVPAPNSRSPAAVFLRSVLWLVVVLGTVMFIWFDKQTMYDGRGGVTSTTLRVGGVQPWLTIGGPNVGTAGFTLNFATLSALAGLAALLAGLGLFALRSAVTARDIGTPASNTPRLSRLALVGALWSGAWYLLWAGGFLICWVVLSSGDRAADRELTRMFDVIVPISGVIVAVIAAIGTTLMGALAWAQIERSKGTLYGRRLAFADMACYPLLAVTALFTFGGALVAKVLLAPPHPGPNDAPPAGVGFLEGGIPGFIVGATVCILLAAAAWRKLSGQQVGGQPALDIAGLLIVACVAITVTHVAQIVFWTQSHTSYTEVAGRLVNPRAPDPAYRPVMAFLVLDVIATATVCFLAGRVVWRRLTPPTAQSNPQIPSPAATAPAAPTAKPHASKLLITIPIMAIMIAALVLGVWRSGWFARSVVHPVWGDTGFVEGPTGLEMGPKLVAKLGIPPHQVPEANRIFQDYYKKYVALERRHTTHTQNAAGKVVIVIEPFVDEMHALATNLQKELGGLVDQRIAPPMPVKGMVHASLPIFRQAGEAKLTVELWKTNDGNYHWSQKVEWVNGSIGSTGYSSPSVNTIPAEYRLYWVEPTGGGSVSSAPPKAPEHAVYFDAHAASVNVVAVTPDGRTMVSCDAAGKIMVLDVGSGGTRYMAASEKSWKAPSIAWLSSLAISPTGTDLYVGGHGEVLHVGMGKQPTPPQKIVSATEKVHLLASYDGGNKLACLDSYELVFHDLQAKTALARVPLRADKSTGYVRAAAASPDSGHIAACFSEKNEAGVESHKVKVYNVAKLGATTLTWNLPENDDSRYARVVFPDSRTLALCLPRGEIRRWTLDDAGTWKADGNVWSINPGRYTACAASRDGKLIYLTQGKRVVALDAKTGKEVAHADLQVGPQRGNSVSAEINSIAATDQLNRIVAALWDGRVAVATLVPTKPADVAGNIAPVAAGPATIIADKSQLPAAGSPGRTDFAYVFAAPPGHGVTVWLEFWDEGKLTIPRQFSIFLAPKKGQPLSATLRMAFQEGKVVSPEQADKMRVDWVLATGKADMSGATSLWMPNLLGKAVPNATTFYSTYEVQPGKHRPEQAVVSYGATQTLLSWYRINPEQKSLGVRVTTPGLMKGHPNAGIFLRARIDTVEKALPSQPDWVGQYPAAVTAEDRVFSPAVLRLAQVAEELGTPLDDAMDLQDVRAALTARLEDNREARIKAAEMLVKKGYGVSETTDAATLVEGLAVSVAGLPPAAKDEAHEASQACSDFMQLLVTRRFDQATDQLVGWITDPVAQLNDDATEIDPVAGGLRRIIFGERASPGTPRWTGWDVFNSDMTREGAGYKFPGRLNGEPDGHTHARFTVTLFKGFKDTKGPRWLVTGLSIERPGAAPIVLMPPGEVQSRRTVLSQFLKELVRGYMPGAVEKTTDRLKTQLAAQADDPLAGNAAEIGLHRLAQGELPPGHTRWLQWEIREDRATGDDTWQARCRLLGVEATAVLDVTLKGVAGKPGDARDWRVDTITLQRAKPLVDAYAKRTGVQPIRFYDLGADLPIDMVLVPGGTFLAGSPVTEVGRMGNEDQRWVTLPRGVLIGKTEVTQAQWMKVMHTNPSKFKGDALPVDGVTWEQAQEFCAQLSARSGRRYRLPTELEWERACRAGQLEPYPGFPDRARLEEVGWGHHDAGDKTLPVGSLRPNGWGLHDMLGNVWELCAVVPEQPKQWVARGGSWENGAMYLRPAARVVNLAGGGLRLAIDLSPTWMGASKSELRFVPIPAGECELGASQEEIGLYGSSKPRRRVRFANDFEIGITEVTQSQWQAVMGADANRFREGPDHPAAVSWDEAQTFCDKLTKASTDYVYRLPTADEWEYACRDGLLGMYGGTGDLEDMAWHQPNSGGRPHAVATKLPSAFGLYDTHGNVEEWCQDAVDHPTARVRALRGGSAGSSASQCRSASEGSYWANERGWWTGLRIVRERRALPAASSQAGPSQSPTRTPDRNP